METKPHSINVPIYISQQTCTFINSVCLEKKQDFWYCTVEDMETQKGCVLFIACQTEFGCLGPAVVLGVACPLLLPFLKLLLLLVKNWEIVHKNQDSWLSLGKWNVLANQTLISSEQSLAGAE